MIKMSTICPVQIRFDFNFDPLCYRVMNKIELSLNQDRIGYQFNGLSDFMIISNYHVILYIIIYISQIFCIFALLCFV